MQKARETKPKARSTLGGERADLTLATFLLPTAGHALQAGVRMGAPPPQQWPVIAGAPGYPPATPRLPPGLLEGRPTGEKGIQTDFVAAASRSTLSWHPAWRFLAVLAVFLADKEGSGFLPHSRSVLEQ